MKKMKKAICLGVIAGMTLTAVPTAYAATDVSNHWAAATIQKWINQNRISGYPDNTFRPNNPITRAEFATMLTRTFGYTAMSSAPEFMDVPATYWAYNSIQRAVFQGVITGYGNGRFQPGSYVTRQEAAVMLSNALGFPEITAGANRFTDSNAIGSWSKGSIGALASAGVISGRPNGSFAPKDNVTRAEAVTMLEKATSTTSSVVETPVVPPVTTANDYTLTETRLTNRTINGDLIIPSSMGSKSITLDNVDVKGSILVRGGGTIRAIDCSINELSLRKDGVTFQAEKTTSVSLTTCEDNATLTGDGFDTVRIEETNLTISLNGEIDEIILDADSDLRLRADCDIERLEATKNADTATLQFTKGAKVGTMDLYDQVRITGTGKITRMNVYASGVRSAIDPDRIYTKNNAKSPTITDDSSSSSSSNSKYDNLTIKRSNDDFDGRGKRYNNVTVNTSADISDFIVMGNLTISSSVGRGTVELTGVDVRGNVYIEGGGDNSVILKNCTFKKNVICDSSHDLAVKFDKGNSVSGAIQIRNNTELVNLGTNSFRLDEVKVTGKNAKLVLDINVDNLTLSNKCDVTLSKDRNITALVTESDSKNSEIRLNNSSIDKLSAKGDLRVDGTGTVKTVTSGSASVTTGSSIDITNQSTNKDALNKAITNANKLLTDTKESTNGADIAINEYWAAKASREAFQKAITTAQKVASDTKATQSQINAAVTTLNTAITAFEGQRALGTKAADKAALNNAIADANKLLTDTKESTNGADIAINEFWAAKASREAFQKAITDAQGVANDANATQSQVNTAVTTLNTAITAFEGQRALGTKAADKAALNNAITTANALLQATSESNDGKEVAPDQYWATATNIATFQSAIDTAQKVASNANASQTDVDSAKDNLASATDTFKGQRAHGKKAADKTALNTAIADAEKLLNETTASTNGEDIAKDKYWATAANIATFQQAITTAQKVASNDSASQTDVDSAKDNLASATDTFKGQRKLGTKAADKAALNTAITTANALLQATSESNDGKDVAPEQYWATAANIATFQQAITDAQDVADNATQSQVNAAVTTLNTATTAFQNQRHKGSMAPERAALRSTIAACESLITGVKSSENENGVSAPGKWATQSHINTFKGEIDKATFIANKADATTAELTGAKTALEAAKNLFATQCTTVPTPV